MSRFILTLLFSLIAMSGIGTVIYGVLMKSSEEEQEKVVLGFPDSSDLGHSILDDMGHEGMKLREKETFDPEKHKPESIDSKG
jgi:hypothetical protein